MVRALNERPVLLGASFLYTPSGTAVYHTICIAAFDFTLVNRCTMFALHNSAMLRRNTPAGIPYARSTHTAVARYPVTHEGRRNPMGRQLAHGAVGKILPSAE